MSSGPPVTQDFARWIARRDDSPTNRALRVASHVFLDWLGVTLAGSTEPIVAILLDEALEQEATGREPIIGRSVSLDRAAAARINGAASHALDFDDVNTRMRGHPSVTIIPAILAASEKLTGPQFLDALITGTEIACCLGEMMGETHYARGFHATATVGTIAAAAAASRIHGLDEGKTAQALSLAATQASGLRTNFGTMTKPLHAGLAAEHGLMAARWAMRGMTASLSGLEDQAGFGQALSDEFKAKPIRQDREQSFGIEQNVFKFHAACYYTHSAMEAAKQALSESQYKPELLKQVKVYIKPGLEKICDIQNPQTGLEVKFSVRHLVAMTLLGRDTSEPSAYNEALAMDGDVQKLRQLISVHPLDTDNRMQALVQLEFMDGTSFENRLDVSTPASDLDAQELALRRKFTQLAEPYLKSETEAWANRILDLEHVTSMRALLDTLNKES